MRFAGVQKATLQAVVPGFERILPRSPSTALRHIQGMSADCVVCLLAAVLAWVVINHFQSSYECPTEHTPRGKHRHHFGICDEWGIQEMAAQVIRCVCSTATRRRLTPLAPGSIGGLFGASKTAGRPRPCTFIYTRVEIDTSN